MSFILKDEQNEGDYSAQIENSFNKYNNILQVYASLGRQHSTENGNNCFYLGIFLHCVTYNIYRDTLNGSVKQHTHTFLLFIPLLALMALLLQHLNSIKKKKLHFAFLLRKKSQLQKNLYFNTLLIIVFHKWPDYQ